MTPAARHLLPLIELAVTAADAVPNGQVSLVIEMPNRLPVRALIPLSAADAIAKAGQEAARMLAATPCEP